MPTKFSDLTTIDALADSDIFAVTDSSGSPDSRGTTAAQLRTFILDMSGAARTMSIKDNEGEAFKIAEGANNYLTIVTTNGSERILMGKNVTFTSYLTVSGSQIYHYHAVNGGNPQFHIGSSAAEEFYIQAVYDGGEQTLNYIHFYTKAESATADKGRYIFTVDEDTIFNIDDAGIYVKDGGTIGSSTTHNAMTIAADGTVTFAQCIADGTCEIIANVDAISVIADIMKTGSGKINKYGHEKWDMAALEPRYPYLFIKRREDGELKYYDKLGSRSDLLYRATLQLDDKIALAMSERATMQTRIEELEATVAVREGN